MNSPSNADDAGQRSDAPLQPDRVGSPFAVDPPVTANALSRSGKSRADTTNGGTSGGSVEPWRAGPVGYTALGSVWAAALAVGFAAAAVWYFPTGAIAVAILGCALALFGLSSPRRITASVLVATHLALLVGSVLRVLG